LKQKAKQMKVELISVFGNDTMVVETARVSYSKTASNYTDEQNEKLINFLSKHNHWSPFSHPKLQFRLQIPIYVERQLVKTQAGVEYNSISGRYVDFSDTYTTIKEWRKQSKDSKQGSEGVVNSQELCSQIEKNIIIKCKQAYNDLISMGVSKEQARTILPLNLNTTMIWTGSLYSIIRLCKQRLKKDAQQETREVVELMLQQVKENGSFEQSLKAFEL
jgi:thymidylate synthase (FAD)